MHFIDNKSLYYRLEVREEISILKEFFYLSVLSELKTLGL